MAVLRTNLTDYRYRDLMFYLGTFWTYPDWGSLECLLNRTQPPLRKLSLRLRWHRQTVWSDWSSQVLPEPIINKKPIIGDKWKQYFILRLLKIMRTGALQLSYEMAILRCTYRLPYISNYSYWFHYIILYLQWL